MTKVVCANRLIALNVGGASGLSMTATAINGVFSVGGGTESPISRKMSKKLWMPGLTVTGGPLLCQMGVRPCTAAMFRPLSGSKAAGWNTCTDRIEMGVLLSLARPIWKCPR